MLGIDSRIAAVTSVSISSTDEAHDLGASGNMPPCTYHTCRVHDIMCAFSTRRSKDSIWPLVAKLLQTCSLWESRFEWKTGPSRAPCRPEVWALFPPGSPVQHVIEWLGQMPPGGTGVLDSLLAIQASSQHKASHDSNLKYPSDYSKRSLPGNGLNNTLMNEVF